MVPHPKDQSNLHHIYVYEGFMDVLCESFSFWINKENYELRNC